MPTFETVHHASVGVLTFFRNLVAHPLQMIHRGFVASTYTTATPTLKTMNASYETPYVWSREFLEQSGYNLTERIPAILGVYEVPGEHYRQHFPVRRVVAAIPPQLIHELSLHWTFTLIKDVFRFFVSLDRLDVAWLLFIVSVSLFVYLCRRQLLPLLSSVWEELKEDVEHFCQRQFSPARGDLHPAPKELPPGTTTISATDIDDMNTSANAIQQRINHLPMSKYNIVRGRTGIVYNANSPRKLQTRLSKAQEALKKEKAMKARVMVNLVRSRAGGAMDLPVINKLQTQLGKVQKALEAEKASHQGTRNFLNHQSKGQADAEAELEKLKARLETGGSELEGHAQLETISETEESPAADGTSSQEVSEESTAEAAQAKRLEAQLAVEQANCRVVQQELEDLQAEYNNLEHSRDTWKETVEALEQQADVKAVRALREKIETDNAYHGRRIGDLETQLGIEQTSREEAEKAVRDFRARCEWLEKELLDDASEQENPDFLHPGPDPDEEVEEAKRTIERQEAGMEYWAMKKEFDEMREKHREAERVAMAEGHGENDDNGTGDDDDKADDGRPDVASKAATDADLAQANHTAKSPDPAEHTPPTEMPLDDGRPANVHDLEPSSQRSSLNGSVSAFIPSALPGRSIVLDLPEHTPAPRVTGPEGVRNPHVQKLNRDVKRLEWRRKSGMPDSVEEEEGMSGPDDVLDDMYDRQVAQFQKFTPTPYARGSMWGALYDVPARLQNTSAPSSPSSPSYGLFQMHSDGVKGMSETVVEGGKEKESYGLNAAGEPAPVSQVPIEENLPESSSIQQPQEGAPPAQIAGLQPSTTSPSELNTDSNAEHEIRHASGEGSGQKASTQADKSMKFPMDEETQEIVGDHSSKYIQTVRRRPSNYFPGIEDATKTHAEEVGDAFTDYVREHATGKLSDSIWATKPDAKQPTPQTTPSTAAKGAASPRAPIQSGVAAPHRAQPRGPPNFSLLPSPQPPPGAPTGPRGHAFGAERSNSYVNTSVGLDNPDKTPRVRLPTPPSPQAAPLPEARDDFNILGASNRRPQQAQQTRPQIAPATRPGAQPQTPAPGSGNRNSGFGARGRGGGRGGRGGGLGTPAPRSGTRSGNSTSDSFRRLQENMARVEAESKRRQG